MKPENIYKAIGEQIRINRETLDLDLDDLAAYAQINNRSMAKIEVGEQSIKVATLYRIAYALKVQPTDLLPVNKIGEDEKEHAKFLTLLYETKKSKKNLDDFLKKRKKDKTDED